MGQVYLIHFEEKLHHAQHYIGYAEYDCYERLEKHRSGHGSKLLRAVKEAGIEFDIVKVWDNVDRNFERKLKNRKKARCMCPKCCEKKEHGDVH